MNRTEGIEYIKKNLECTRYLDTSKAKGYKNLTNIPCPFCDSGKGIKHKENSTAALAFYPNTNTVFCFSCRTKADVLDLIQNEYSTDFNGAFEIACKELNLEIDNKTSFLSENNSYANDKPIFEKERHELPEAINKNAEDYTEFYKECKEELERQYNEGGIGADYLKSRAISKEVALSKGLGFCNNWKSPTAIRNGREPKGNNVIVIPCSSNYYIARNMDIKSAYRYFNEAGNGETCFFNEEAIREEGIIFVTEGNFDALSLIEVGFNAIALNGTSGVNKFIKYLQEDKVKSNIIIALDNDEAGLKASNELKIALKEKEKSFLEVNLGEGIEKGKDPNDFLLLEKETFKSNASRAYQEIEKMGNFVKEEPLEEVIDEETIEDELHEDLKKFLDRSYSGAFKKYKTGVSFIDNVLDGGIMKQSVMLLLASPSAGKTTLCQQIGEAIAKQGKYCIYLNYEMSKEQMIAKSISRRLADREKNMKKYTADKILEGYKLNSEERADIEEELRAYNKDTYKYMRYIDDKSTDLETLKKYLNDIGEQHKERGEEGPVVIVDYLHLISSGEKKVDDKELLKQVMQTLKNYALKYNTFVIAISATGRSANKENEVELSSGRDSSNLEYSADYVLGLKFADADKYPEERPLDCKNMTKEAYVGYLKGQELKRMKIEVKKSRLGRTGKHEDVYYNSAYNLFTEWNHEKKEF